MNVLRSKKVLGFLFLLLLIPTVFASVNFLRQRQTNQQRASSDTSGIISGKLFIDKNENGILDEGETWDSSLNPQLNLTGQSSLQTAQQVFPSSDGSYSFDSVPFSRNSYTLQLTKGYIPNYMFTTYNTFSEKMYPTQDLKQANMGFAPVTKSTGAADTCEMNAYTLNQGNSNNSPAFMLILKTNPSDQHPQEKMEVFTTGLGGGLGRFDAVKTPSNSILIDAGKFGMTVQLQPETQYLAQIDCRLGDGPTDVRTPLSVFYTKTKYVMMTYHDNKHADFTFSDSPITPTGVQKVIGSIKGTMFMDSNYNGTYDPSEKGTNEGQNGFAPLIELYKNNAKFAETHPGADGTYQFANIEAGGNRYQIKSSNGTDITFQIDKANPNQVINFPVAPSSAVPSSAVSNTCSINAYAYPSFGLYPGNYMIAFAQSNPDLSIQNGLNPSYYLKIQVVSEKSGIMNGTPSYTISRGATTPIPQLYTITQQVAAQNLLSNGAYAESDITRRGKITCILTNANDGKDIYTSSVNFTVQQTDDNAYTWTIENGSTLPTSTTSAGGPTPTSTVTGNTTGACDSSKGDVNCDGKVDLLDFNIWRDTVVSH